MKSYLKIAFRNVKNNKFKYTLVFIVFTLTVFSGIFCTTFSDIAISTREEQLRDNTINAQLDIVTKDDNNIYFQENCLKKVEKINGIQEVSPRIGGTCKYQGKNVDFIGINKEKQDKVYPFKYIKKINYHKNNYIIVNKGFLKEYSKKLGDTVTLSINDINVDVKITGIVENSDTLDNIVYISLENAQKLLDQKGKVYLLKVTIKKLDKIDSISNKINKVIPNNLCVEKKYDIDDYKSYVETISVSMGILAIFSFIISIILCYSMYSSLIYQRKKVIGSYRSLGITKLGIYLSLLMEFFIIVIPAVIIGIIMSNFSMKILINHLFNVEVISNVNMIKIACIIVFILVSGIISLFVAARNILDMNVVELIKGNEEVKEHNNILRNIVEIVMTVCCIVLYFVSTKTESRYLEYFNMLFLVSTFIVVSNRIVSIFMKIFKVIFGKLNWKINILLKQISIEIKKMKNSIVLVILVTAIASVSLTVSKVIDKSSLDVYNGIDIIFNNLSVYNNDLVENSLKNISEINKSIELKRHSQNINDKRITITGINPNEYKKVAFEKYVSSSKDIMLDKLNNGSNNIIITKTLANSLKKDVNDYIVIDTINGKEKYKIVGLISSFENKGTVVFISSKNFDKNFVSDYISYFICVSSNKYTNKVVQELKNNVGDDVYYNISTLKQLRQQNKQDNQTIFSIINIVILITLIVCTVCLINNLIINIIKRKKVFAIKRTLGVDLKFIKLEILTEGVIIGFISSSIGIILGYFLNRNILSVLEFYIGDVNNIKVMPPFWFILIAVIIVTICCYYPYVIIKKSNIVNLVKGNE